MVAKYLRFISMFIVFAVFLSIPVSANEKKKSTNSAVEFYIDCQEDGELINIINVSTSLNKDIKLDEDFELVCGGGVTEDTILSYVTKEPEKDKVLKKLQQMYAGEDYYIHTKDGKVYTISELTEDNFDVEWYSMYYNEHWCINGKIVVAGTDDEIIISDDDENVIPPNESDPDDELTDDEENMQTYTSDFAYIYGYNDTIMGADGTLLRSEISAMIHRLVKQNNNLDGFVYDESASPVFVDIEGEWYRSAMEYMNYKGAYKVKKGGKVNPDTAVTRGEAFKLICIGLGFTDNTELSEEEYASIMYNAGYIQGDENGNLNLYKLITRAEFCAIYNKVIGRDNAKLISADGEKITADTYGFTDLNEDAWYYDTMLRATSAYDENGYVDLELRGIRNNLDDYQ